MNVYEYVIIERHADVEDALTQGALSAKDESDARVKIGQKHYQMKGDIEVIVRPFR